VHECHSNRHASVAAPSGYLSSTVATRTQVGSASCPWQLVASPGQRVNVTLFSFLFASSPSSQGGGGGGAGGSSDGTGHGSNMDGGSVRGGGGSEVCYDVATMRDGTRSPRTVTACSGEQRQRQVFVSESNTIQLEFIVRNSQQQQLSSGSSSSVFQTPQFLIHYQCKNNELFDMQSEYWSESPERHCVCKYLVCQIIHIQSLVIRNIQ